jgi:hypothetical protein
VKKRHANHRRKTKTRRAKPATPPPTPKAAELPVPVIQTAAAVDSSSHSDYATILLAAMIGLAFACFCVAAIPATYVPWRHAAYFVANRQVDIGLAGLALLALAGLTLVATRGG